MQNAAGDGVAQAPHDQNDAYRAVVSDLVSLVEHVQNSLRLIEQTIAKGNFAGNFARQPREFHQRHRARRRISPLHEGCRHAASLRRQSWHRPALPAGFRR